MNEITQRPQLGLPVATFTGFKDGITPTIEFIGASLPVGTQLYAEAEKAVLSRAPEIAAHPNADQPVTADKQAAGSVEAERAALKPLAAIADLYAPQEDDAYEVTRDTDIHKAARITLGQCRAARAALASRAQPVAQPVAAGALPKLPEPDHTLDCGAQPFWNADQMRERDAMWQQRVEEASREGRIYQRKVDWKIFGRLRAGSSLPAGGVTEGECGTCSGGYGLHSAGCPDAATLAASAALPAPGQAGFESWALSHGGVNLALASKLGTRNGLYPATYYEDATEIAWRAWANKPSASAALPGAEPYGYHYEWAGCVTTDGPQNFKWTFEREAPPVWAVKGGRVRNLVRLVASPVRGSCEPPVAVGVPDDVAKDAARYRWLRNPDQDVGLVLDKRTGYVEPMEGVPDVGGYHTYEYRAGEELDAAIDAAMLAASPTTDQKGGNHG